jgi:uncharacterized repeat protein (TIGR03803 family)
VSKLSFSKMVCVVFVFCAATAIPSSAQTLTTIYNFCSQTNCADGSNPAVGLIQATDGNFYGTTMFGASGNCDPAGCGTVFKITASGTLTTLHSFDGSDGYEAHGQLLQATDGNFYGTTSRGGANGEGTVFKITPSGTLTTLYSFCSQNNCADGAGPSAGLVQGRDGNFYGTTTGGRGASAFGGVFKITPQGALTTLYDFCSQGGCPDGSYPYGGLVQDSDGNFYGTTLAGGNSGDCSEPYGPGCGTVFRITPSGVLRTVHSFNGGDEYPMAGLVQATDGNFYGTTFGGGMTGSPGTVFKIPPGVGGLLTTLYSFCSEADCADGRGPHGTLVQANDGNLYGTTSAGGAYPNCSEGARCGTVFAITLSGTLTTLHSFDSTDGADPVAALVQATDGSFYGTTWEGGAYNAGTVFRLRPLQLIPVRPCRLVDTRNTGGPIQSGTSRDFAVPQLGGCNIPTNAAAYSLNVTVVPHQPLGFLTIWPTGQQRPLVSTLNSMDGRVKANAAIVSAGTNGAVSVYVSGTSDVILDIDGYFALPSGSTLAFYTLTPCRVVDTRQTNFPPGWERRHSATWNRASCRFCRTARVCGDCRTRRRPTRSTSLSFPILRDSR